MNGRASRRQTQEPAAIITIRAEARKSSPAWGPAAWTAPLVCVAGASSPDRLSGMLGLGRGWMCYCCSDGAIGRSGRVAGKPPTLAAARRPPDHGCTLQSHSRFEQAFLWSADEKPDTFWHMGRGAMGTAERPRERAVAGATPVRPTVVARRVLSRPTPVCSLAWPDEHTHLAAIVEHSNDAIFSRTLEGGIITWNASAERIFGFRAEEVIGQPSDVILPHGHRDEFGKLLACIRRGEVVEHFETVRLRKDSRHIHVSLTLSPIRDSSGRLIGFSTIARDITEQRRVLEALERRERELDDLFEEASVGLLLTTPNGRILRANPALLAILECQAEDCVGRGWHRFHPDRAALSELLKRMARRETARNLQTTLQARGKGAKEVLLEANGFWQDGKLAHIRWFVRDITRRQQLEREILAISERERCTFSRDLHDGLGQQLSGIAYLSNVVRDRLRERGSPEAAELDRISKLLKQAIEETRRVSRGLSPVRSEAEGLDTALGELAAHTSDVFGIACRFRCPAAVLVSDSTAATHLYRIAQEAVNNAIRHGHARRITIGLTQQLTQVVFTVMDNGKGIRALSPRRKGLGLRVMQYRISLLRGSCWVRPRASGGTEVRCISKPPRQQLKRGPPTRPTGRLGHPAYLGQVTVKFLDDLLRRRCNFAGFLVNHPFDLQQLKQGMQRAPTSRGITRCRPRTMAAIQMLSEERTNEFRGNM